MQPNLNGEARKNSITTPMVRKQRAITFEVNQEIIAAEVNPTIKDSYWRRSIAPEPMRRKRNQMDHGLIASSAFKQRIALIINTL